MAEKSTQPVAGKASDRFAMTGTGLILMVAGIFLMILGYILMAGGHNETPDEFNTAMFSFRRLVLAPVVIVAGLVVEIVAIMWRRGGKKS
ncbi:MAG: DUF3098 domain-containing protein [Bacteroidales bacterium]|nr:DUF3098 domain-containing protein [Bacteroidales bacterium]